MHTEHADGRDTQSKRCDSHAAGDRWSVGLREKKRVEGPAEGWSGERIDQMNEPQIRADEPEGVSIQVL